MQTIRVICMFIVQAKPAPNHSEFKPWETAKLVCFIRCEDGFGLRHLDTVLRREHWELLAVKKADILDERKVREHGDDFLVGYESAERNGFHVFVFPEHFGAGRGRTPFAPPRINERFVDAMTLAKTFKSAKPDRIEDLLETLASLGQTRALPDGKFVAA